MTVAKSSAASIDIHIKSIKPVIEAMRALGFSPQSCIKGTGLHLDWLEGSDDSERYLTLEQEYLIYQNILQISQDPYIGLKIGRTYRIESFGMLGYAMLTARTAGEAMHIGLDYDPLSFGHFKHSQFNEGSLLGIAFQEQYDTPESLLQIFSDRALEAARNTIQTSLGFRIDICKIRLMHKDENDLKLYEEHFGCPVELGHHQNEILFDKSITELVQPRKDPAFSQHCLDECKKIIGRLKQRSEIVSQIREIILAEPGYFPTATDVAQTLECTTRTLRRKLSNDGTNYQAILNEIRSEIAKDYLKSSLPIEKISEMLGFSEASAFSNAFKTWESISPKDYRLNNR
ncbi:MAG: AraC family transcriptional regulator ligand-binding domain-containing protein [Pseudomonadales bacterium]